MIAFWNSSVNPSCPSAPNLAPIREKYGVVENIIPGEVLQAKMHKVSDIRLQPPDGRDDLSGFSRGLIVRTVGIHWERRAAGFMPTGQNRGWSSPLQRLLLHSSAALSAG